MFGTRCSSSKIKTSCPWAETCPWEPALHDKFKCPGTIPEVRAQENLTIYLMKEAILLSPGYILGVEDQDTCPADVCQSQEPNPYLFSCSSTGSLWPTGIAITITKPCAFLSLFLLARPMVQMRPVYLHSTFSALDKCI